MFNRDVADSVAAAVADEAKRQGAATADEDEIGYAPDDTERLRAAMSRRRRASVTRTAYMRVTLTGATGPARPRGWCAS